MCPKNRLDIDLAVAVCATQKRLGTAIRLNRGPRRQPKTAEGLSRLQARFYVSVLPSCPPLGVDRASALIAPK